MNSVIKSLMLCFLLSNLAFAAETIHNWGSVYNVSQASLDIKSQKVDNGIPEGIISCVVDSRTIFEGVRSVLELTKGEFVIVDYKDSADNVFKAVKITVPGRLEKILKTGSGGGLGQANFDSRIEKMQGELNRLSKEVAKIKDKFNIE